MPNRMTVSLILFTMNEIDGMRAILPKIQKDWYDELIVVDGQSTDGTYEYAKELGLNVFQQEEKGLGAAFCESVARASCDIVITFTPDGNSLPEKIPEIVEKMHEGYDVVIASRYLAGAKSYDDDPVTSFGNWMFTTLINVCFGGHVKDGLVMYRGFKRKLVYEMNVDTRKVAWGTQFLSRAMKNKIKIGEVPADEPKRIGGERKMSPIRNGLVELGMIFHECVHRGGKK